MHEDDLAYFSQSLDNAPLWALLKGMQVITGPRPPKITFGYVLNHLPTKSRFSFKSSTLSSAGAISEVPTKNRELARNNRRDYRKGSDRTQIKARLDSTEQRRHFLKS